MNKTNDYINKLTPELIQQYLDGQLSSSMQHTVEKYLLDHPFEYEAMQGLENYKPQNFSHDIDEIIARLPLKSKPRNIQYWTRYKWIAAAVMLLLASTFILLKYTLLYTDSNSQVVQTKTPNLHANQQENFNSKIIKKESEIIADTSDSPSSPNNQASRASGNIQSNNQEGKSQKNNYKIIKKEKTNQQVNYTEDEESIEGSFIAKKVEASQEKSTITQRTTPSLESNISQSSANPNSQSQLDTVTKNAQQQTLKQRDEQGPVSLSTAHEPVALSQQESLYTEASPLGGYRAYHQAIRERMIYPKAAIEAKVEGKVTVQCNITKSGKVENIIIKSGLGYGCDEEAIRLVESTSKWKPAYQNNLPVTQPVTIEVIFKLD